MTFFINHLFKFSIFVVLYIFHVSIAQVISLNGFVVNEQDQGISHVNVVAQPSNNGTQTDENGQFQLDVFHSDSLLHFSHIGYSDSIVFIQPDQFSLKIELISKVIEMSELDVSGRSRTHFDTFDSKNIVNEIDLEELAIRGFVDIGDALFSEQTIIMDETNTGKKTMSVRGSSSGELVYLYDGIRINNMGDTNLDLTSFSTTGLSSMELVKGNHDLALSSSGTINFVPKLTYGSTMSFNQKFGTYDYGGYGGHLSLGNNFIGITSGLGESNFSQFYSGHQSPDISTVSNSNFVHLGIKPINSIELKLMSFNSDKSYLDQYTHDTIRNTQNNYIGKINFSHSSIGDLSVHGLLQHQDDEEYVGFNPIQKKGNHFGSGLFYKKKLQQGNFQFRLNQSNLVADWNLESSQFSIQRNQLIGAGVLEITQSPKSDFYLKDLKILFEFQKIEDSPELKSDSISAEFWTESNTLVTGSFIQDGKGSKSNYYFNLGNTLRFPTIQERIANAVYSPIDSLILSPEQKFTYEFGVKINGQNSENHSLNLSISSFKYHYKNKIKIIQFSGKPLQYPINFGDASLMGFDANMNFITEMKTFEFSSSYSKYFFSDRLGFPLQPESLSRSSLMFNWKRIRTDITYRRESSRILSIVSVNDVAPLEQKLDAIENVDAGMSFSFPFKDWNFNTSFSAKNLLNNSVNLNGISLFDKRYILSIGVSWK